MQENNSFHYDIFISYRRTPDDRNWVHKKFVPALEAEGLRVCLDDTCFRLGAPILMEMERAVLESRYTVAVFSPDYMNSGFTELENIMAQHLGLESSESRFIGIIHQDCSPSLRIRTSLMLDMTDNTEFELSIKRIAHHCIQ